MKPATIAEFVPRERFDPEHAALRRIVFAGHGCWRFALAGDMYRLQFVDEPPLQQATVALRWRLGSELAWFGLESVEVFHGANTQDWVSSLDVTPLALSTALLIEDTVALAQGVARACAAVVVVLDMRRFHCFARTQALQALHLCSESTGVSVRAVLCAQSPGLWRQLAAGIRRTAGASAPPRACLRTTIALAPVAIDVHEYVQLGAGDILVFARSGSLQSVSAWLLASGHQPLARACLSGQAGRIAGGSTKETGMEMVEALLGTGQNGSPARTATVQITAILGQVDIPWRGLDTVEGGYVFELPCDIEHATVKLYAGHRLAGEGRIVAVGERLGVCVTRWDKESGS